MKNKTYQLTKTQPNFWVIAHVSVILLIALYVSDANIFTSDQQNGTREKSQASNLKASNG